MNDPIILCHPNIPKPLHGIAPRVIMGQEWWDIERKKAYAKAGFCCEACGIAKADAKYHKWLEAHEFYLFDYLAGALTFDHLVALCHSCHNFIHNGRMEMLVDRGEMEESKYKDIMRHGLGVIKKAGLQREYENRHKMTCVEWEKWRIIFNGKKYGPSSKNYARWLAGDWRNWKP